MENISTYRSSLQQWRKNRYEDLTAPTGWLNIIGRWESDRTPVNIGSAAGNEIQLPYGPDHLGQLEFHDSVSATWTPQNKQEQNLLRGVAGWPKFDAANYQIEITMTGDIRAVRIRDRLSDNRHKLKAIPYYEVDPAYRIVAEWIKLDAPKTIEITTSMGHVIKTDISHKARFSLNGEVHELLATFGSADRPQFVFLDTTSETETYEKARFVFGESVTADSIVLDFNKAMNPPCALTKFATCPLPPQQNIFNFAIEAGEKRFSLS